LEDNQLLVEIVDNGAGIPSEVQAHMFEPFFTTKPVGSGTGLGLIICNRIVADRHGGEIEFESKPGETRFKVRLPVKRNELSAPNLLATQPNKQMIHEIKSSDWPTFCQRLTQQRAGATVKLETIASDGVKTEQVASALFESLVFDNTDACNDVITLRLRSTREIVHEIIDPIRLTLHPSGKLDSFNLLQIAAENGLTTITLHPAIHAQMLSEV